MLVPPDAAAGDLTVRQLNAYVTAEFERLVALGFAAGEDFTASLPCDETEVRWAVSVFFGGAAGRRAGGRMVMPSDRVVGRADDGGPRLAP